MNISAQGFRVPSSGRSPLDQFTEIEFLQRGLNGVFRKMTEPEVKQVYPVPWRAQLYKQRPALPETNRVNS